MKKPSIEQKVDFVHLVAERLAEYFAQPLYGLSKVKNYYALVSVLEEIIDWSHELSDQHYSKLKNWNKFQSGRKTSAITDNMDEFVIAFGRERFKRFCIENEIIQPEKCPGLDSNQHILSDAAT